MKVLLKICSIIAVFLVVSSFYINVNAQEYNGIIYQAEKIDGVYFYKHREDTDTIKYNTHNFYEEAYVHRRSSDNLPVYCIESWNQLTGATKGDYQEENVYDNLTKRQKEQIELIAYYGYGYHDSTYNHTDLKWYAITQYMIWLVEAPEIEHYFVESIGSKTPIYPFNKEIAEIEYLVKRHNRSPNFNMYNSEIYLNEELTLTDSTGIINDATLTYTDNVEVSKKGNTLMIKPKAVGRVKITLTKENNRFNYQTKFYISTNYQDCMLIGDIADKNYVIALTIVMGHFKITKYGEELAKIDFSSSSPFIYEQKLVSGIKFKLYAGEDITSQNGKLMYSKDEFINEYITLENGIIEDDLPFGKYYLHEDNTNSPYINNSEVYEFILTDEERNISLDIENKRQKVLINLKKIGKNTLGEDRPLAGVLFGLYNEESIGAIEPNSLIKTARTNELGEISFLLTLPPGKYYLRELECPNGYVLDDKKIPFTYELTNRDEEIITLTFTHYNEKVTVEEIKVPKTGTSAIEPLTLFGLFINLLSSVFLIFGVRF